MGLKSNGWYSNKKKMGRKGHRHGHVRMEVKSGVMPL